MNQDLFMNKQIMYDFYVFDENYNQIMKPRIYMNGKAYDVVAVKEEKKSESKEKERETLGKITLPYCESGVDVNEQLIIIEDRSVGAASAVLRSFKRHVKKYELRGGFYIEINKK